MNNESSARKLENVQSPKPTFPYQMHTMERRQFAKQEKAKREAIRPKYSPPKNNNRLNISVDSSKAKSNLDVLRLTLKELGWREYPYGRKDGNCDVYWLSANFLEQPDIITGRVNKFPGMIDILRKANLARSLDNMRHIFPEEYNFYPKTWFLPQQMTEFTQDVKTMNERNPKRRYTFIVKPNDGCQGDGIYLIKGPDDIHLNVTLPNRSQIVQDYVSHPFLIDGLKFDLRVYCILVNLDPLEIYISKEGLARFCTMKYQEPCTKNLKESYMHLTNYSLNKRSSTYVHSDSHHDGSKRTISSVFAEMGRYGHNIEKLWRDIEKVLVKTLIAIVPELKVELNAEVPPHRKMKPKCFQILGFDILLTDDLRPILLEVNANPSLRIDYDQELPTGNKEYVHSIVDEEIKRPLIRDTLLLIAPKNRRKPRRRRRKRLPPRASKSETDIINEEEAEEEEEDCENSDGSNNKENKDSANNNINLNNNINNSSDDPDLFNMDLNGVEIDSGAESMETSETNQDPEAGINDEEVADDDDAMDQDEKTDTLPPIVDQGSLVQGVNRENTNLNEKGGITREKTNTGLNRERSNLGVMRERTNLGVTRERTNVGVMRERTNLGVNRENTNLARTNSGLNRERTNINNKGTAEVVVHGLTRQNTNLNNSNVNNSIDNNASSNSPTRQVNNTRSSPYSRPRLMVLNHEPDQTNNSDEWEDDDDILEQIYPSKYAARYDNLRLFERVTSIFQSCLGVKGSMRMGSSGFRTFTRKCQLVSGNLTNADMDLIYLEMQRKWDTMNSDRTSGLTFQGFIEAFFMIAKRKFYSRDKIEMLENMLEYCEAAIEGNIPDPTKLPSISKEQARIDEIRRIYITPPAKLGPDEKKKNSKKSAVCSVL